MKSARTLKKFASVVHIDGPAAGLAYLNEGVPHRFSAVYRFAGEMLENVLLHDKLGEMRPDYLAVVPFEQSFCQFVLREGVFRTDDTAADRRLDGHPYQGVVLSYHSVPVADSALGLWGTLCHFDLAAHPLPDSEFELLQGAARLLPASLVDR
jgi:GAF domain-containing protein